MLDANQRRPFQFQILTLVGAVVFFVPLFVAPLFEAQPRATVAYECVVFVIYICAMCWIVVRHFDRRHAFRRFPFRGSLWIGGTLGSCYAFQRVLGIGIWMKLNPQFQNVQGQLHWSAYLLIATIAALFGLYPGAVVGLVAGWIYCQGRRLFETVTGYSTIRPGQAEFKRRQRESSKYPSSVLR